MPNALVSIVMPTYNRALLIGESIQSIVDQTYPDWELIVVDDGSTDNTADIINSFGDNRIRYLSLPHFGFLGKVKNAGIRAARGDLIAFQDSDDLWRRDKLAFQVSLLNRYPGTYFVLSNGDQFGEFATKTPNYTELFVGRMFLPVLERAEFCFYCPSLIFKKSVMDTTGMLDESVPFMRDLHFFLRMSHHFDGIFTNERLISVRKHAGNFSNTFLVNAHVNNLKMLQEFYMNEGLSSEQFNRLSALCYYRIGLYYLRGRDPQNAIANFLSYSKLRPLDYKGWIRVVECFMTRLLHKTTATS